MMRGQEHDDQHQQKLLLVGRGILGQPPEDLTVRDVAVKVRGSFVTALPPPGQEEDQGKHPDDGPYQENGQIFTH